MIKYIESQGFKVVGIKKYHALVKDYDFFLHKKDGREVLHKNHFYFIREIEEMISGAFSHGFECGKCRYKDEAGSMFGICAVCTKVQSVLKAM